MAIDKPGFKFPDETEEENKAEDENLEIEVFDDTPEEDKNKEPLPEKVVQELYNDELEDYSTKVKKKLMQMKRLAHDERREKEKALREQQEAINLARNLIEENKRLKTNLHENQQNTLATVSKSVELEIDAAKRFYKEAYESGDPDKLIEAQQKLTETAMKAERVRNFKPAPLQTETNHVQIPERQQADPTAVRWQKQNPWFGDNQNTEHRLMTSMALALHEQLKEEGVVIASQEYYDRINQTMRNRFPEKFGEESDEPETRRTRSSVVAPATRSTASKKIRLSTRQMAIAKKLGLTPEQYALEVTKMES